MLVCVLVHECACGAFGAFRISAPRCSAYMYIYVYMCRYMCAIMYVDKPYICHACHLPLHALLPSRWCISKRILLCMPFALLVSFYIHGDGHPNNGHSILHSSRPAWLSTHYIFPFPGVYIPLLLLCMLLALLVSFYIHGDGHPNNGHSVLYSSASMAQYSLPLPVSLGLYLNVCCYACSLRDGHPNGDGHPNSGYSILHSSRPAWPGTHKLCPFPGIYI